MSAAVRLVHVHFLLATYVKEILSRSTNTDAGEMITPAYEKRNASSIGAWPNFLDQRLTKYFIVSPLLKEIVLFLSTYKFCFQKKRHNNPLSFSD